MIRKITLSVVLFFSISSFAQIGPVGHLTVFSEDGDKFTLILNGEVINDVPQTNLRVEDLNQPYYNAKIKFEDASLQEVSKNNLMITDVDGIFSDVTYKIKRDKNKAGKMKFNYFSAIPVQPNFIPASNVHVIHYGQPRPVGGVTQTTTTTTVQDGVSMGVGVNVNGVGIGMNVNINDNLGGQVSQTTTTTTTHSGTFDHGEQVAPRGCSSQYAMSAGNFSAALNTVKGQGFDETRLKIAKQIASANCLNVNQIMQIAQVFGFEETKLDFAKFAYDFCTEPRNYFNLNSIFDFSTSVDSLTDYIQSRN
jgi:hypothetical protein